MFKRLPFIILSLLFIHASVFAGSGIGSAVEPRNDFAQTPGFADAEYLDVYDIAVRAEIMFEGIFNKRGDGWYTTPHLMNNYFRYDSSDRYLKDQDWKDHWGQTMWLDVAFKPATWASAQFGLMFIGDYASRYWTTVNHPHRMFDNDQVITQFSWNTAKAEIHNDWAKLQYKRNLFHYHWGYEGDLFNIYQAETGPNNLLMITGRPMPEWYQLNMEGKAGNFELQYGEPITDYKQGFYLKYRNIFGSNMNFFYVDHEIPYGDEGERMRTAEVSTDFNISGSTLQLGAKFRPFRIGDTYDYVAERNVTNGTNGTDLLIKQDRTNMGDAFGGAAKVAIPKSLWFDVVTMGYLYEGISAGNKQKFDIAVQQAITPELTGHFAYVRQKPLLQALPARGSKWGPDLLQARGPNQPFWVWWRNAQTGWDNRETDEFTFTFTYDPTPETWFYQYEPNTLDAWNLNPEEDALLSFAAQVKLTRYMGGTDRQVPRNEYGEIVWEGYSGLPVYGALPTNRYLGSLIFLTRIFFDDYEIIYDFEVGEDPATLSTAYTSQEVFLKEITGFFKTNLAVNKAPYKFRAGYGKDVWGPNDWHRDYGASFDEVYYAQISREFTKCIIAGVDYVGGRKTDYYIVKKIDGDTATRNELGTFDEVRTYLRLIFEGLFKFGTKPRIEKDETLPTCSLSLDPDVIMPSKGQKTTLYPLAYDENGIATWEIRLLDKHSKLVYTFSGLGECPESVKWNGKDFENRYLPDDVYDAQLIVSDTFGNIAKSNICQVRLITPELKVEATDRGLKLSFSSKVLFDFDKTNIKPSADKILREATRILNSYVKNDISVEGHTDAYGSDEYNQGLSERRARSVANYLSKLGVDRNRMSTVGMGERYPVATNKTAAGRELNRRVEILILKKDPEGNKTTKETNVEYVPQKNKKGETK